MNNIWDIYNFVKFVTDKARNGYVSPDEVSQALDAGQSALFKHYNPEDFGSDPKTNEALSPFFRRLSASTDNAGEYNFPPDFAHVLGVYSRSGATYGKSIDVVLHVELGEVLSSIIYPVDVHPRYLYGQDHVLLFPNQKTDIFFHYLKKPDTPVIGYSVNGNEIVYDPLTSTQLEFSDKYWLEIIQLAMPYIGVNLSNQEVASLVQTFNPNL